MPDKNYYGAKSKIGASAYKKTAGPHGFEVEKATKARDEADAEVRRETKGASGKESLDAKRDREAAAELRRESRDLGYRLDDTFLERQGDAPVYMGNRETGMKKGGKVKSKVSSASKRADGCAQRGKTRGKFV